MSAMHEHMTIPMPGGSDGELPRFIKVRQTFSDTPVADVDARIAQPFA